MARSATIDRRTGETEVRVELELDGSGAGSRETGVGFLDHMLDLLARHGKLGLVVEAAGDLDTGAHHTVEDVGIVLGQALDEALAECAIDLSGRPHTVFNADLPKAQVAGFETELAEEFFRAVANSAKLTLHINVRYGSNVHHMIEGAFKAFARALRLAVSIDPEETGVPSTKGTLSE